MLSRSFRTGYLTQLTTQLRTLSLASVHTGSNSSASRSLQLLQTFNTATTTSCLSHQSHISCQRSSNWCHQISVRTFSTSLPSSNLMEFFDDKSNWAKENIKTGRPWHLEELRLKSNEDLHKLWYILLKERNVLMTMEAEYTRKAELFPNPERLFKVDESMQNILEIVAERDDAFSLLETGKSSQPQYKMIRNFLGLKYKRRLREHAVPYWMNRKYRLLHTPYMKGMSKYMSLYFEKQRWLEKNRERKRRAYERQLKQAFPHLQLESEEQKQSI